MRKEEEAKLKAAAEEAARKQKELEEKNKAEKAAQEA